MHPVSQPHPLVGVNDALRIALHLVASNRAHLSSRSPSGPVGKTYIGVSRDSAHTTRLSDWTRCSGERALAGCPAPSRRDDAHSAETLTAWCSAGVRRVASKVCVLCARIFRARLGGEAVLDVRSGLCSGIWRQNDDSYLFESLISRECREVSGWCRPGGWSCRQTSHPRAPRNRPPGCPGGGARASGSAPAAGTAERKPVRVVALG